jgi:hypothetical protein
MTAHLRSVFGILGGGASGVLIALAIAGLATPTTVGVCVAIAALSVIGIYACKAVEKDGQRKVDKARHPASAPWYIVRDTPSGLVETVYTPARSVSVIKGGKRRSETKRLGPRWMR